MSKAPFEIREISRDFFTLVVPQRTSQDVITFQINYLALADDSHINDLPGSSVQSHSPGFFYGYPGNNTRYDISDIEELQSARPNQIFFHWTASLARNTGTYNSTIFNAQMRQYANSHKQILLDYADIMSHNLGGVQCYDVIADGVDYPAICPDYTSEVSGGHLGSMATGALRIAKAYWVLMAQIAGWDPNSSQLPTPTQPQATSTPTLTVTLTPSATPLPIPGDANLDGAVDGMDYVIWLNHYDQSTPNGSSTGDFDNSGTVDGVDYVIWLTNYTPI